MKDEELDRIERELHVRLPENYRRVSRDFPFRPIGNDVVYWFFDTPDAVISETLAPLTDGDVRKENWKASFVVIGSSAAGDLYLLDTTLTDSPVFCLSHEDHWYEEEYPDLERFVADYQRLPEEIAQQEEARRETERLWWQNARRVVLRAFLLIAGAYLLLCLLVLLAHLRKG